MNRARVKRTIRQFVKFGIVGGSGVVVNLLVTYVVRKLFLKLWAISEHDVFVNLLGTSFNIRWYHVYMTIAFVVANTWNYQLNRSWTFRGATTGWLRGLCKFMATGLIAFMVSQVVATLLMNPESPLALSSEIFDDSTGLRTKFYWVSAIAIGFSMPVNFVINKVWTFRRRPTSIVVDVPPS